MATPPPASYPPGYLTETHAPQIITILSAMGCVATLAVVGRLAARAMVHKVTSPSDICVVLGLLGSWCVSAINIYGQDIFPRSAPRDANVDGVQPSSTFSTANMTRPSAY
jgi:hypothetical protein